MDKYTGLVISTLAIIVIGYIGLGFLMMGLPHRCKKHGLQYQAVCFKCEEDNIKD